MSAALSTSQSSTPVDEPWTIHDSNVALHECLSSRNPPIPNEIILQILDDSSRWIRTRIIGTPPEHESKPIVVGVNHRNRGELKILDAPSLSSFEVAQIRSIVFNFRSRDQGWSHDLEHHRTFDGSWTWMEASLSRPTPAVDTQAESDDHLRLKQVKENVRYELQRNRHAGREIEEYRHELGLDHELLQIIEDGDSVVLWARAMFQAWENRVYSASIEIWCVDDLKGILDSTA